MAGTPVMSLVFVSPVFPDASGSLMPWPIVGGRVLIYYQVGCEYGDFTADTMDATTCVITAPSGAQVNANIATDVLLDYQYAFEFYPTEVGVHNVTVSYAGGLDIGDGMILDPSFESTTFKARDCYGTVVEQETCWDDSIIVTKACTNGYITDTGATCPPVCTEGTFRTPFVCEDGSTIYEEICQENMWVASQEQCPIPKPFPWWLIILAAGIAGVAGLSVFESKKKKK